MDLDLTPGREGAPILIKGSEIGEFQESEGAQGYYNALILDGEHKDSYLWFMGGDKYQLADGRAVRLHT